MQPSAPAPTGPPRPLPPPSAAAEPGWSPSRLYTRSLRCPPTCSRPCSLLASAVSPACRSLCGPPPSRPPPPALQSMAALGQSRQGSAPPIHVCGQGGRPGLRAGGRGPRPGDEERLLRRLIWLCRLTVRPVPDGAEVPGGRHAQQLAQGEREHLRQGRGGGAGPADDWFGASALPRASGRWSVASSRSSRPCGAPYSGLLSAASSPLISDPRWAGRGPSQQLRQAHHQLRWMTLNSKKLYTEVVSGSEDNRHWTLFSHLEAVIDKQKARPRRPHRSPDRPPPPPPPLQPLLPSKQAPVPAFCLVRWGAAAASRWPSASPL